MNDAKSGSVALCILALLFAIAMVVGMWQYSRKVDALVDAYEPETGTITIPRLTADGWQTARRDGHVIYVKGDFELSIKKRVKK